MTYPPRQYQSYVHCPKNVYMLCISLPLLHPQQPLIFLLSSDITVSRMSYLFWILYCNHTVHGLSHWPLPLTNMHLRFFQVSSCLHTAFPFRLHTHIPLSGYPMVYLSSHLLRDILVSPKFWQLVAMNKAVLSILVQVFVENTSFQLLRDKTKDCNHQILQFTFIRNLKTKFRSGCTILHFHRQRMRVPDASHPPWHAVSGSKFNHSNRCVVQALCWSLLF